MLSSPRARRGWSLLELIIVVCVVAILATVLLERMLRYQEIAEKTAMETTLGVLRSALSLKVSARIVQGGLAGIGELAEENPMDWLADRPAGYLGARHSPFAEELPKGSWCFDLVAKELIYRPQRTRFFSPPPGGAEWLRFKAVVRVTGGERDQPIRQLSELGIRPTTAAKWSPEF
jgi:prepilin-type N-terminal cleavage/methylation domain-containing protein